MNGPETFNMSEQNTFKFVIPLSKLTKVTYFRMRSIDSVFEYENNSYFLSIIENLRNATTEGVKTTSEASSSLVSTFLSNKFQHFISKYH